MVRTLRNVGVVAGFFFAGMAFGTTTFYAGNLTITDSKSKKKEIVEVAYRREVEEKKSLATDIVVSLYRGARYQETYAYDFTKQQLRITSHTGKLVSTTPFKCEGTFPSLKSCHYDFVATFEVKGEDVYLEKAILFKSTLKDRKAGITYVTDGRLPQVNEAEYQKKLGALEKIPYAPE